MLRNPPSTWCGGWPGRGSVPTLPQATSKNNKACNTADRGLAAFLSFEKALSSLGGFLNLTCPMCERKRSSKPPAASGRYESRGLALRRCDRSPWHARIGACVQPKTRRRKFRDSDPGQRDRDTNSSGTPRRADVAPVQLVDPILIEL